MGKSFSAILFTAVTAAFFSCCSFTESESGAASESAGGAEKQLQSARKKKHDKSDKKHKKHKKRKKREKSKKKRVARPDKPNVVVFLVDALRRDHLRCYGYEKRTSPNIDALAKKGMLFENALSQAPWTPASVASLMTSRYPSQTGVDAARNKRGIANGGSVSKLRKKLPTLADTLRKAGYRTAAISTNMYVSKKFGMLRGFQKRTSHAHGTAPWVFTQAVKWTARHRESRPEEPFFLYLHFMDVHDYQSGPAFRSLFFDEMLKNLKSPPENLEFDKGRNLKMPQFEMWKRKIIARYDAAIAYVDNYIGDFVKFSKSEKFYSNTLFVVMADHGEEFWEHALVERRSIPNPRKKYGVEHGHTLFGELLRVPMVFHGPQVPAVRNARLVRNLDAAPSILGYAGLSSTLLAGEGVDQLRPDREDESSYRAFADGAASAEGEAFAEGIAYGAEARSLENERFKLIESRKYSFFFDKVRDPFEQHDATAQFPDERAAAASKLNALVERIAPSKRSEPVVLDKATEEVLRSLGYLD